MKEVSSGIIYKGRFDYAGGLPSVPKAHFGGDLAVRESGIEFLRLKFGKGHRMNGSGVSGRDFVFFIPTEAIRDVHHDAKPSGFLDNPDQFIEVEVELDGTIYCVRFKAAGFMKQKDAFNLYAALNTLRANT